jgi:hypothetical protein
MNNVIQDGKRCWSWRIKFPNHLSSQNRIFWPLFLFLRVSPLRCCHKSRHTPALTRKDYSLFLYSSTYQQGIASEPCQNSRPRASNFLKLEDRLERAKELLYFFALIINTVRISITVNGLLASSIVLSLSRNNLVLFLGFRPQHRHLMRSRLAGGCHGDWWQDSRHGDCVTFWDTIHTKYLIFSLPTDVCDNGSEVRRCCNLRHVIWK